MPMTTKTTDWMNSISVNAFIISIIISSAMSSIKLTVISHHEMHQSSAWVAAAAIEFSAVQFSLVNLAMHIMITITYTQTKQFANTRVDKSALQ